MAKLAMHSSATDQHYTPPWILDKVREHWGSIDLDPCTSEEVNQWSVRASLALMDEGMELTKELNPKNGLKVWCNPPSTYPGESLDWLKMINHCWEVKGTIEQAYFLLFNRENLGKVDDVPMVDYLPRVNFSQRLKYWAFNDCSERFEEGNWATVGNDKQPDLSVYNDGHYWRVLSKTQGTLSTHATKKEAITSVKGLNYRLWTNRPTHQSTLIYFPPLGKAKWILEQTKFEQVWESPPIPASVVRTRYPENI